MKRINIVLMAFALVLTMTQCKKNEETNQDETVTITLDVKGNNGSKVDVNTITGTVNFETGDKVYVGSGGKYVGFLTHNGTNFVGNITNPTEGQPLQFYFLGNVTPIETLSAGTTEECSVIISDQTEHLPVISTAASNENYVSGVTSYTGHLLNKCALVKFNVTTPSNSPICITGMKNKVTVDFTNNTLTPSQDGEGIIMLSAGSGEKWAILLPQQSLDEGEEGSVYSYGGNYSGIRPEMPTIVENGYFAESIAIQINTIVCPVGGIRGLFTINDTGKQVFFSQGNLQYLGSAIPPYWKFAEHQWDYLGSTTGQNSDYETVDRDLFGWATSGYNHGGAAYQPWNTSTYDQYYAYGIWNYNLYDETGQADWGYNAIVNGGNMENQWRTLTDAEWGYVLNSRTTSVVNGTNNARYAKAKVSGVYGVILFPDSYTHPMGTAQPIGINDVEDTGWNENNYSSTEFTLMEANGAVFLPAAGHRSGTLLDNCGHDGHYWSSSYAASNTACELEFSNSYFTPQDRHGRKYYGYSVRLVQDY